jgi:hypothetical protein
VVAIHRLVYWPRALLVASTLGLFAHAADDGTVERWSVALSWTGPCPAVIPPPALNMYVTNLTDGPLSARALTFSISADGRPYCTANHALSQALSIAPHSIRMIGVRFDELHCRDERGRTIPREDVFKVLARSKWSVTASILDGASTFTSNSLEFPLAHDPCEAIE